MRQGSVPTAIATGVGPISPAAFSEVVIWSNSFDNCALPWCFVAMATRSGRRRHGHHLRLHLSRNVLEDPTLHPLHAGGLPAGGGHATGGDRFDAGATA